MPEVVGGLLDPADPLPFEHLFIPLVLDARKNLLRLVSLDVHQRLTLNAHAGWERYLLTRLSALGSRTAYQQFSIFRTVREAFPRQQNGEQSTVNSLYREFVGDSAHDRLGDIFERFPVLRALCRRVCGNWVSTVEEFLLRLDADHDQLAAYFNGLSVGGQIVAIEAGLSDPHRGGRCVVRVSFAGSGSLFYKPRSIVPEALFASLLDRLNLAEIPFPLRSARCWDRENYGWMEDIASDACSEIADVQTFYWRAGALLGLLYLSQSVDCHRGNLTAAGPFPVLVDLETLWHPQEQTKCGSTPDWPSVLRTGFLPPPIAREKMQYQWSALERAGPSTASRFGWTAINSDAMAWDFVKPRACKFVHLPRVSNVVHLASSYASQIQAGFQWLGEKLLGSVVQQRAFQNWLAALADCPRRRILRPSAWYHTLLERSTQPQFLTDGASYAQAWAEFANATHPEARAEFHALEQCDLPYFLQSRTIMSPIEVQLPTMIRYTAQMDIIAKSLEPTADVCLNHSNFHHGGTVVQRTS